MEIEVISATAALRRKKVPITYDCQHLQIERSSSTSISGVLRTGLTELITVTLTDTNNQPIELIKRVPLGALAAFEQHGSGYIYEKQTGAEVFECTVPIRLANVGIHIPPGGKLQLLIDDMLPGATYTVSVLEVPFTDFDYTEAVVLPSTDNQERTTLYMQSQGSLVIPALPIIDLVRLHFNNGKTFDYTLEELLQINSMSNDIETWSDRLEVVLAAEVNSPRIPSTAVLSGSRKSQFVIVAMSNVNRVDIDTDGTALDVYQFIPKQLPGAMVDAY